MYKPDANFFDIENEAKLYFKARGTGKGSGYKQYQRWRNQMISRVDRQGNLIHNDLSTTKANNQNSNLRIAASNLWTELGPAGAQGGHGAGLLRGIVIDPTNANIIYAVSSGGGLWKTTNGGTSWLTKTDKLSSIDFHSVAIASSNTNILYVGGNNNGIFKSIDGGNTFTTTNFIDYSENIVRKIIIHPTDPNTVLAACSKGVYKSTNGGSTWTNVIAGTYEDIEFKPNNPNTVYASGDFFSKSTNGGTTFTTDPNIPVTGRMKVSVTAANANYVYLLKSNGGQFGSIIRSTDSGTNFTYRSVGNPTNGTNYFDAFDPFGGGGIAWHAMEMEASPTNAEELIIGSNLCHKSTNGGTSFNILGYHHWDVHAIVYSGNNLYTGTDGGIYKSTDAGLNWTQTSNNMGIRQLYSVNSFAGNDQLYACNSQDNGAGHFDGTVWNGLPGPVEGESAEYDAVNGQLIYVTSYSGNIDYFQGAVHGSIPLPTGESNDFLMPTATDPIAGNVVYGAYRELYKYTNFGNGVKISNFNDEFVIQHIALAKSDPNYIYVAKENKLYRTKNGGSTWQLVFTSAGWRITDIAVHPSKPGTVVISNGIESNRVLKSSNSGDTWTDISYNLPQIHAGSVAIDNGSNDRVYVGLDVGVYQIDNSTNTWTLFDNGLPNSQIRDLDIHLGSRKIRAATYGRGIWEASLLPMTNTVTVSITSPANNASFVAPASITINATAADANGTVSKVEFYNGITLLGSDLTSPYSYIWTGVAVGNYSITAKATNTVGEFTTSTAVALSVVSNTPPTVSITSPANNASFVAPASITINATAADANGTVSKVEFYKGTTLLGSDLTSPYSYVWTGVAVGNYSITARATDNAGAVTTSTAIAVSVVTNTPPTVSITSPANNASFVAPASITINATAADANGTVSKVEFFNGTTLLGSDLTSPYSYVWTGVAVGNYSITAKATDNAGAVTTSTAVAVSVTNTVSDILGPNCGSNNATLNFELSPSKQTNATSYNWWYNGSIQSITPVVGSPYKVTILTGATFSAGDICVGVNYAASPYYASYCKTISVCLTPRMAEEELEFIGEVVPNPTTHQFIFNSSSKDVASISVMNELGQLVYQKSNIGAGSSITLGDGFVSGIYMMSIRYTDGISEMKRLVKLI